MSINFDVFYITSANANGRKQKKKKIPKGPAFELSAYVFSVLSRCLTDSVHGRRANSKSPAAQVSSPPPQLRMCLDRSLVRSPARLSRELMRCLRPLEHAAASQNAGCCNRHQSEMGHQDCYNAGPKRRLLPVSSARPLGTSFSPAQATSETRAAWRKIARAQMALSPLFLPFSPPKVKAVHDPP